MNFRHSLIAVLVVTAAALAQAPGPQVTLPSTGFAGLDQYRASRIAIYTNDYGQLARYRDANAALKAPAPNENRVVFFGDSITEVHGFPDPALCTEVVRDLVNEAKKGSNGEPRRVAICGECAPTLIAQGNTEGAIRLEHLWDQVTRSYDADTLCGYLLAGLPGKDTGLVFQSICAEHSAVYGRALGY